MRAMRRLSARVLLVAAGILLLARSAPAAVITVVNLDGTGEGFNDPTPLAPVGGNTGTTRGAQRLIAFQYAADLWGAVLKSDVEIRVGAHFDPLPCSASSAVLGQAGPMASFHDFVGAPFANTWYAVALANSLAGMDLDPGVDDIAATFNSVVGAGCAFSKTWYYGLDGGASASEDDFVTVVLHEVGHGLGFLTFVDVNETSCDGDPADGSKANGRDDAYMRNLEDHSTGKLWPIMTDAERLTSSTDTGDLHWVGAAVVAAGGFLTAGRDTVSGHVEIYAPSPLECGSSVSHFSTALTPNEIMEPKYTGPNHNLLLTSKAFTDEGWSVIVCGDGVIDAPETCDDGNTTPGDGCSSACQVEECYSCTGEPSTCTPLGDGSGCDDGNVCTQTDTCTSGTCTGSNPITCTPLDSCHDAGTCDPVNGCSNPPKADGSACNDGDTCTGPDTCTAGVCGGTPSCIDHFLCYKSKVSSGTLKITPILAVSLVDDFESLTVDLTKTKHLCTPADKNGEGTVDPATHLKTYQFKPISGSPKHVPQTSLVVTNQLGTITLNTVKPALLLVPAAKDLNVDPPPPPFGSHEVDHYKCYKTKITPGTAKFLPAQVSVSDQFTLPKTFDLKKIAYLCSPVDKNGSTIKHPNVYQLCYKAKIATGQPKHTPQLGLHVADQFGLEHLDTKSEDIFCVPSQVAP
jgi:cysteine-rich repeat protein